jgi:3-methyladenine DNA glycosylase/8-oxoguanine DNA glycosylase
MVEVRELVCPRWVFRLPGGAPDGVLRCRGGVLERLMHVGDEPVVVRVAQPASDGVLFGARAAARDVAAEAISRMRFALGVDDDLRPFHDRFRSDPLIGRSVRARPWLRIMRRPEPFEALAWAICEQLIEFPRAVAIQRRIVARLGRRCAETGLRDLPPADRIAGTAPALLQSFDLSAGRAIALRRAAREVAAGRADLRGDDHERVWRRLRAIPGIGAWTIEMLALHGQGRYDQVPAGDLNLIKLAGRITTGNPRARCTEEEVRALFAPYDGWGGLAAAHAMRAAAGSRDSRL